VSIIYKFKRGLKLKIKDKYITESFIEHIGYTDYKTLDRNTQKIKELMDLDDLTTIKFITLCSNLSNIKFRIEYSKNLEDIEEYNRDLILQKSYRNELEKIVKNSNKLGILHCFDIDDLYLEELKKDIGKNESYDKFIRILDKQQDGIRIYFCGLDKDDEYYKYSKHFINQDIDINMFKDSDEK